MALTYEWKLTGIKKANGPNVEDVVIGTRWELKGTDEDGISGVFSGATPFKLYEMAPEDFVPYSELTEEIVLGWIQAEVVDGYLDHVEKSIAEQILAIRSQVTQVGDGQFPWSPAPEEVVEGT